jgi:hypothetical protein
MTTQIAKIAWGFVMATMVVACNRPDAVEHREGATAEEDATKLSFDPETIDTVTGVVGGVEPFQTMRGTRYGIRIRLMAEEETFYVYLAPEPYLNRNHISVEPNDIVEVTGSVLSTDGRPVIIATEINKEGTVVTLRDDEGVPTWRRLGGKQPA